MESSSPQHRAWALYHRLGQPEPTYNTPAWWREAKLGAWSHWDPQSMAEDGDWYSRGMYMEGHPQSKFHREHFGHPSEYGYKGRYGGTRRWQTRRRGAL
jgi:hypothetical protein